MYEFHTTRRIEFADTDMAGIVHFSRYFIFMETAEHDFLRSLGHPVHFEHEGREIGWPRVAVSCQYLKPARLDDVLDIRVRVRRKGRRSMTYEIVFRRGEEKLAEGQVTTICCAVHHGPGLTRSLEAIPIPAFLADQIEEAPIDSPPGAE